MNKNPIGKYIAQCWYLYAIAFLAMLISILLDVTAPKITKSIIDDVIVGGKMQLLTQLLLAFVGIGFGRCIFQYLKEYLFDFTSAKIASKMRVNLFRHIQKLSADYFGRNNTGELMARVKDDVDKVWNATGFVGMLVVEGTVHIICVVVCMVRINPLLSCIPILALPLVGSIALQLERKLNVVYEDISEQNAEMNVVAQENLAGVRTVKAFAREDYEMEKFQKYNKKYYDLNMKQAKTLMKYDPLISFTTKILLIAVIMAGGAMVIHGKITIGELGAFTEYANNIIWPMEIIGWLSNDMASAIASNKKINRILAQKPDIKEPSEPADKQTIEGELTFDHVDFQLDGTDILKNVSFQVQKGKTLGIMGMTGAGKSSVVNLAERFYDVTGGAVLLDGVDIRKLPLHTIRENIAVVSQDVFLFSDTISENIRLGQKQEMPESVVKDAIDAASARSFVERMTDQYDTVIGERGVGLSGGQKQRLSIARAFAKKAPILILDDSTSALDMETECAIEEQLKGLTGTTKIIIAHRISAVRNADEIVVLDKGQIAERGTHEELMAKKGFYYATYEAQYGDYHKALEVGAWQ